MLPQVLMTNWSNDPNADPSWAPKEGKLKMEHGKDSAIKMTGSQIFRRKKGTKVKDIYLQKVRTFLHMK
ncbi:hypothetical protein PR048_022336 [Dryococelus australis]|uniref:Uncharacterized protein n=1 Tax=Dryococelus australis TaxID=614101 RepID=A0ABQ9H0S0_9NEOP|nr:hypothetical protein PR048_022336 [Dryococelus australis]